MYCHGQNLPRSDNFFCTHFVYVATFGRRERSRLYRRLNFYTMLISVYVCYYSRMDSLSTELWCFACDIKFATRDGLALHVANSATHRSKEILLTLPVTADCYDDVLMDSAQVEKSPSIHVCDWLLSADIAATVQKTVEAAIGYNPRDVSKFAGDLKKEMDESAVPCLLHVVVVTAATTVMKRFLDAAEHVTECGATPLPTVVAHDSHHPLPELSAEAQFEDYDFLDEVLQTTSDLTIASEELSPSTTISTRSSFGEIDGRPNDGSTSQPPVIPQRTDVPSSSPFAVERDLSNTSSKKQSTCDQLPTSPPWPSIVCRRCPVAPMKAPSRRGALSFGGSLQSPCRPPSYDFTSECRRPGAFWTSTDEHTSTPVMSRSERRRIRAIERGYFAVHSGKQQRK